MTTDGHWVSPKVTAAFCSPYNGRVVSGRGGKANDTTGGGSVVTGEHISVVR
ncbi:hypothetical protein J7I84_01925 [Arthrobacter sp. ISL-85]|uniref:hypothetical protein n=1 Tax=Arthrobacter sp. ISL-85 TaxID=2819115 RepID=UPI001BE8AB3D|nr:hypothetical protein [Arthrobacter sp. ISL-85]MBT2565265.1 hypothetical protein [Arthrobacter sp. ISL-85]